MTKYNAIIMNIVPITSKWHSFRLNGYLILTHYSIIFLRMENLTMAIV